MDFRIYNGFLDPVFIMTDDGYIQYHNPAAARWLSLTDGEQTRGKHFEEFMHFHDASLMASLPTLKSWEKTQYTQTVFDLPKHGYQNVAKITAQCIPIPPDAFLYAVIIRDKVYVEALWEEDQIQFNTTTQANVLDDELTMPPIAVGADAAISIPKPGTGAPPVGTPPATPILNTEELLRAMPKSPQVQISTRVMLNVPSLRLALKCQAILISEEWIDMLVKTPHLKPGVRCMIEVIGPEIAPFTTAVFVETYQHDNTDIFLGRFKYDNLSASAKKIITTFLEKNAVKL